MTYLEVVRVCASNDSESKKDGKKMTVKKVNSHAKVQVLGNRNRKKSREEHFSIKSVSSKDVESFEASSRPENLNWMEKVRRRWFME